MNEQSVYYPQLPTLLGTESSHSVNITSFDACLRILNALCICKYLNKIYWNFSRRSYHIKHVSLDECLYSFVIQSWKCWDQNQQRKICWKIVLHWCSCSAYIFCHSIMAMLRSKSATQNILKDSLALTFL